MKRKAFIAALSILGIALSASSAFAWTNPSANPATGGGFVVAEQNSPANAIYIRSNGNIGIGGVTVPAEKLDVSGNIKTNGSIKIYNGATQVGEIGTTDTTWFRLNQSIAKNIYTPQYLRADGGLYVDSTSYGINGSGILLNGSLSGTYSNALTLSSTSNSYAGSTISTTGASYLATSSGNVGVGTATANSKLTVAGLIETTTGGVKFPDGTTQITAGAGTTMSAANVSSGDFGSNTGGGNYSFPGSLGVGTTSTDGRLVVQQNMSDYGTSFTSPHVKLLAGSTVDTTGFVGITYAGSTSANYGWSVGALRSGSGQSDFVLKHHSSSAVGTEWMRIKNTGEVGIGTTTPGQKLSVAGTIESTSGGIKFPDGSVQTKAAATDSGFNFLNFLVGTFRILQLTATSIGVQDSTGTTFLELDEGV
jgi:hypothetical protein